MNNIARKYYQIEYSEEQKAIGEAISQGYNVCVNAVAGSGKTTSVIHAYASMRMLNGGEKKSYILFNILTDEQIKLSIGGIDDAKKIMNILTERYV